MGASERLRDMNLFESLSDLAVEQGSSRHPFVTSHVTSGSPRIGRSLADAVHHLAQLHGQHPGVIEILADRRIHPALDPWLAKVRGAMNRERAYMTRLIVAAGPIPSTPQAAQGEAALAARRHALDMLARSERYGTSLGAALALSLDWQGIRALLDVAAHRFGVEPAESDFPGPAETGSALALEPLDTSTRALDFGARQLLHQHDELWSLLAQREASRENI